MGRLGRFVGRLWDRGRFFLSPSQAYWHPVAVLGFFLLAIALATWKSWQPWSTILAGIGGSVLATVIVTFAGPAGDPVYQAFVKLGVTEFFPSRDKVPKERWVAELKAARHHCVLLGQAHGEWCLDDGFRPALTERLRAGVAVEMFFLDPTCLAAKVRHEEDTQKIRPLLPRIRATINEVWGIREDLDPEAKNRLKIWVYGATPSLGLTWVDSRMLVTHYLAGSTNRTSPALLAERRPGSDTLYAVYEDNVNKIRKLSTEVTHENLAGYTEEPNVQR